jgi:hypothetical protein
MLFRLVEGKIWSRLAPMLICDFFWKRKPGIITSEETTIVQQKQSVDASQLELAGLLALVYLRKEGKGAASLQSPIGPSLEAKTFSGDVGALRSSTGCS